MVRIPQSVKIVGAVIGMTNAVVLTPSIYQFVLNHPYWERRVRFIWLLAVLL